MANILEETLHKVEVNIPERVFLKMQEEAVKKEMSVSDLLIECIEFTQELMTNGGDKSEHKRARFVEAFNNVYSISMQLYEMILLLMWRTIEPDFDMGDVNKLMEEFDEEARLIFAWCEKIYPAPIYEID